MDQDLLTLHAPMLPLAQAPFTKLNDLSSELSIGLERLELESEIELRDSEVHLFVASLSYALEAVWHHEPLTVSTGIARMDDLFAELSAMTLEFSFSKPQAQEKLRRNRISMELKRRYRGPGDRFPVRIPYPANGELERPLTEPMDEKILEYYFKAAYGERP